jgi:hypothetical protein
MPPRAPASPAGAFLYRNHRSHEDWVPVAIAQRTALGGPTLQNFHLHDMLTI